MRITSFSLAWQYKSVSKNNRKNVVICTFNNHFCLFAQLKVLTSYKQSIITLLKKVSYKAKMLLTILLFYITLIQYKNQSSFGVISRNIWQIISGCNFGKDLNSGFSIILLAFETMNLIVFSLNIAALL